MRVYVVEIDNGCEYDYDHDVQGVFETYRGATEYLMSQGFNPYHWKDDGNQYHLEFYDKDFNIYGWILEFDLVK